MSQGLLDGYNGIKLVLPNGRIVTGKVMPLRRAAYFIDLWAQKGTEARDKFFAEFPKEVGLETELNELTIEEFWEVADAFFGRRVKPGDTPQATPPPALTGTVS